MTAEVHRLAQPVTFEDFWKAYPSDRKKKKPACEAMFNAITSPKGFRTRDRDTGLEITLYATAEELVTAAKAYRMRTKGSEYVCMPSTWLNQGRWQDDDDNEALAEAYDRQQARPQLIAEHALETAADLVRRGYAFAADKVTPDHLRDMIERGLVTHEQRETWRELTGQ